MTTGLAQGVSRAPIPFDPDHAADVVSALSGDLTRDALGALLRGAAGSSPFLAKLLKSHGAWLAEVSGVASEDVLDGLVAKARESAEAADWQGLLRALRVARARAALFIALCDLGGAWDLGRVTRGLSDIADGLTETALRWILAQEIARGKLPGMDEGDAANGAGLSILAMGKMGARELNYSSDIDLICLFDQDRFEPEWQGAARARHIHAIRRLVKALSEWTSDGYVFRVDLRLRPSPSTTPVCMGMGAARDYYATAGRTWERAAHIKARPAAGDLDAGRAYLRGLASFIWRRPLDFAAIEDIEGILRKIRVKKGHFTPAAVPGCDIKLSPGGIREIELFAQTRQLIMAGRLPGLREPTTLGALAALRDEGMIDADMCENLSRSYIAHRTVEHRLQMIGDRQTQTVPADPEARARVAALDGWSDMQAWEAAIAGRLATVHRIVEGFFDAGSRDPVAPPEVPLDGRNVAALGFADAPEVRRKVHRWRTGGIAATGSDRARRLYATLEPELLRLLGQADSPDAALAGFDRFLSGLSAGVPIFSLFKANRHLLERLVDIFAAAPRLAGLLGRRPQIIDALLEDDFFRELPDRDWLEADLRIRIGDTDHYESVLETARIWAHEVRFRVAVQVLLGKVREVETGEAFSRVAETILDALVPLVVERFASKHGPPPGRGMAVIAMGRLGTREMTARSDLDLIAVYDADGADPPDGAPALSPPAYYSRLTRSLITALTADTAEGRLYPVDMRLRPSGRQGPVAVSLAAFEDHQIRHAWVWEHLALMRGRVVAGDAALAADIGKIIGTALSNRRGDARVMEEARAMRGKLMAAHRAERGNPWALKHAAGGLMEIEFLAQTGGLLHGVGFGRPARDILGPLADIGWIGAEEARDLARALRLQSRLQQIDCVALERPNHSPDTGARLRRVMVEAGGVPDFDALSETLRAAQGKAASTCARVFGDAP